MSNLRKSSTHRGVKVVRVVHKNVHNVHHNNASSIIIIIIERRDRMAWKEKAQATVRGSIVVVISTTATATTATTRISFRGCPAVSWK
jgi:hypothetical protein